MEIVGVIPARFGSTRFEGKVLASIHGKPMVQHVYERAMRARRLDRVLVATEDERVVQAVKDFGGEAVLTSPSHVCGTDRIAEAIGNLDVSFIVNIQGDEPMLAPEMIDEVIELLENNPAAGVSTLMRRITREEDFENPGAVKVVTDVYGRALYFSRSLIPYPRFRTPAFRVFDHIGIYGYRKEALAQFAAVGPSRLELIEGLEQLRALENGITIMIAETRCTEEALCVDTAEDLERVRALLAPQLPGVSR
jgi:3-deoxy-manno-octulosonate cytidylyltransferase (CMP-KDO synthetase)